LDDRIVKITWRNLWHCWLVVILISSTYPWTNFAGHAHWDGVGWIPFQDIKISIGRTLDALANLALYVPLGFTYMRARPCFHKPDVLKAVFLAAMVSVSCETYQIYCHGRFPSMTDLTVNVIGALFGVVAAYYLPIKSVTIS
jgi:glycopeptide antibiotics resistance protein